MKKATSKSKPGPKPKAKPKTKPKTTTKRSRIKMLAVTNVVLFVATIIVNTLGAQGFINGSSQADVSKMFPTMITPAGFTFSIWGVIYTLLGVSLLVMLAKHTQKVYQKQIERISVLFWLSCAINMIWIVAFSCQFIGLSAILIVALLASVFCIIRRLADLHPGAETVATLGFGLYGGWLAIASVVNFCAFLVSQNFQFWGEEQLFYTILLAIFIVGATSLTNVHKNTLFNVAIAWAFFGIVQRTSFEEYGHLYSVLLIGIVLLVLSGGANLRSKLSK
ncbi:tryptophan-rich sensory protein [Candidatus Saccharibacteria bacterium]|nr:MAG: tryptophan-rich sensory protein [Candidatus Saccharibacteria bacterium]